MLCIVQGKVFGMQDPRGTSIRMQVAQGHVKRGLETKEWGGPGKKSHALIKGQASERSTSCQVEQVEGLRCRRPKGQGPRAVNTSQVLYGLCLIGP